jgi:hypothetical protein
MNFHAIALRRVLGWALACLCTGALAAPPTNQEIVELCTRAEDPPHCGKLIERRQLLSHGSIAQRDGPTLTLNLRGKGQPVRFRDVDDAVAPRDYSLWDVIDAIDCAVVWLQEGESSRYLLVNLGTGVVYDMPGEPLPSPDAHYVASADFCPRGCANELALWEVKGQHLRKALVYGTSAGWTDAGVRWTGERALALEIEIRPDPRRVEHRSLELSLDDPAWRRQ